MGPSCFLVFMLVSFCSSLVLGSEWAPTQCGKGDLLTQWGKQVDPNNVLPEYPRPQLTRPDDTYKTLNGIWQFQPGNPNDAPPFGKTLSSTILVPFPVESCLSGVGQTYKYLWYRLIFDKPASFGANRTLIHFGAVDWQSTVYVNTQEMGVHTGGYDRFTYDITSALKATGNELIVRVFDPSDDGYQPEGKQRISAINNPGGDTYTPASGIWQTVWLESVPNVYISGLRILADTTKLTITTFTQPDSTGPEQGWDRNGGDLPNMPIVLKNADYYGSCFELCRTTAGCVAFSYGLPWCDNSTTPLCWLKSSETAKSQDDCRISGSLGTPQTVLVQVLDGTTVVATGKGLSSDPIVINIPNPKLWGPNSPFLYTLKISTSTDSVGSYFGMRSVTLGTTQHAGANATGPQTGIDRSGGDLPNQPTTLSSADPTLCESKCAATSGCVAWAYAVPNCDGFSQPTCWLKGSRPGTSAAKCRISGEMGYQPFTARRPFINGEFTFLAGWLDQSFWPDGIYTAPTDEALAFDLKAVKTFGLNTVRLHQKVNSERWYWYADSLGIIILQDMFQKYGGATHATIQPFVVDYFRMVGNEYNHPSIVQWEVFNEFDCVGVFDAAQMVQFATDLDPSRLIDTNSGGPANNLNVADVNDIHTYPYPGDPIPSATQYGMIGEFGGVGAFVQGKEWVPNACGTYLKVDTPQDEADTYVTMVNQIIAMKQDISVSIYTQIADVELECDGFLNYDRTNKFTDAQTASIASANQKLIKA